MMRWRTYLLPLVLGCLLLAALLGISVGTPLLRPPVVMTLLMLCLLPPVSDRRTKAGGWRSARA